MLRIKAEGGRRLHDPGRQPVPDGRDRAKTRPRSTRWASATRSASRSTSRRATSTWRATARTPARERQPRAQRPRRVQPHQRAGQLRLAVLRGNNTPYNDYDFANSTAGATFNCAAPVNDSPNNTGLTNLPAAKPAVIWQSNNASITGTPGIGCERCPDDRRATYHYDPDLDSDTQVAGLLRQQGDSRPTGTTTACSTVQMNGPGPTSPRSRPVPAAPSDPAPARHGVRPRRLALHDRVGQRASTATTPTPASTGSTTSRARAPSPRRRPTRTPVRPR